MANYNSSHTGAEIDSAIGRVKDTAVTAGTVSASLGVVVDANKDISGFRNVTLTGQLQAATINLTGDTTIGDGDTDNITINADVNSNIIPNTDNTFDLGSASKQWKDLYVNGIGYIDQLGTDADPIAIYASSGEIDGTAIGSESASTGAFTTISASGNVDFNGDLDVDGTTNLDVVDIDGAVDMASTLAVSDAVTFAKSTNGDYKTKIYNANAGTATEANIYITNSSSDADGLFAGVGGTSFTTASGFVQDGAWIGSGSGASGGLSIMTRANADMRFYTNGHTNLAMTIDSSQRVGIGVTSPSASLHVSGSAILQNDSSTLNFYNTAGAQRAFLQLSGTGLIIDTDSFLEFKPNNSTAMYIDSSGNVGIGTTSPASLLHIESNSADPTLRITNKTAAAINTGPDIEFWNNPFTGSTTNSYESGAIRVRKTSGTDNNHDHYMSFETRKNSPEGINEHMRITSGGQLNGGDDPSLSASQDLSAQGNKLFWSLGGAFGGIGLALNCGAYTSSYDMQRFYNGNGQVGAITASGSGTSFTTSSDYRLKENEVLISDGLTRLNQLKPYRFNFIADADTTVDGFFAHEVSEVVPEAITGEKDAVDDDGNIVSQGIDQSKLVPLLVKALQEADDKIDALTARIEALEA